MKYSDILVNISNAYDIITQRIEMVETENSRKGRLVDRVQYEDVSLDDIMDSLLLPLLPELIEFYSRIPHQYQVKVYRIYIATLCEIVKNGLVNGGILKTMDARMGKTFDRNHHYDLLQKALHSEGIDVLDKSRKYEETIINEAGIPRNYHATCLEIFSLYWKWLRNYQYNERKQFLFEYFNDKPINKIYILEHSDAARLLSLKQEIKTFSSKVIKTCLKLDVVFSAIDRFPGSITTENLNEVAEQISANVGFNIFSIVRSGRIKEYILDYAKRISFLKFDQIIAGLPGNEEIILPNGCRKKVDSYSAKNFLGGRHVVRGNAYDVSYPVSLAINELFNIPENKIHMLGNAVLYTSEEPIFADIDGVEKEGRLFINEQQEYLYVFYERIAAASFAYIDGDPVDITSPFSRKTYIGKCWNQELHRYQLALILSDIRFADYKYSMKPVQIVCNGENIVSSSTNKNGAFRIQEKICFVDFETIVKDINLSFIVDGIEMDSWEILLDDFYLWNKQTGIRIKDKIEVREWYGTTDCILFSRDAVTYCSTKYEYLYSTQGFLVYSVMLNFSDNSLNINNHNINIMQSSEPYILLGSEAEIISGELCIKENVPITLLLHNYSENITDCHLVIEYEMDTASYNLKNLKAHDLYDITQLLKSADNISGKTGKWRISLNLGNKCVSRLSVVVVPYLTIRTEKKYYSEEEDVYVTIQSASPCFEAEGEYVCSKRLFIGSAQIQMDGNHVGGKILEFDCSIDKCGISKQFKISPRVWGLRLKNNESGLWENLYHDRIDYSELDTRQLFVCSTSDFQMKILSNGSEYKWDIQPGYSKINLRNIVSKWKKKNLISFIDGTESEKVLSISYLPRYTVVSVNRNREGLLAAVQYQGPIDVLLSVRVFSGTELVRLSEKEIYNNQFIFRICVLENKLISPEITIEARIDNQDYQLVGQYILNAPTLESMHTKEFHLNANTSIIELLSTSNERKSSHKSTLNSIIDILTEGRRNG